MCKKLLLSLFILFNLSKSDAQSLELRFENISDSGYIDSDTFRNTKPWQIAFPNKSVFKYDGLRKAVIITDSMNQLSDNDTFSYVIKFVRDHSFGSYETTLYFIYQLNGDSGDHAVIEISPNMGKDWIDFHEEDTIYDFSFNSSAGKPKLNGSVLEWSFFKVDFSIWANEIFGKGYPHRLFGVDTILFRFTYITGNSGNHGDGMMIDNIRFNNFYMSLPELNAQSPIKLFPNPAREQISIANSKPDNPIQKVIFYDLNGRVLHEHFTGEISSIDVSAMPPGLYTVLIETQNAVFSQRLLIAR